MRRPGILIGVVVLAGSIYLLRLWSRQSDSTTDHGVGPLAGSAPPFSEGLKADGTGLALDRGITASTGRTDPLEVSPGIAADEEGLRSAGDGGGAFPGPSIEYEGWDLSQLIAEKEAITIALRELADPIIQQRFQDNLAEFVSAGRDYPLSEADTSEIVGIQTRAGGQGTYRTVLPRSEFPELYEMLDRQLLLKELIRKKRAEGVARSGR